MNEEANSTAQEEDFEIFAENHIASPDDAYFDEVVGALQDIMMDQEFEGLEQKFMTTYYMVFENSEENKMQYMEIFNLYQQQIEHFVQQSLHVRVSGFEMGRFVVLLKSRTDQIDDRILDMIDSFTDFETFKKLMLDYRKYMLNEDDRQDLVIKNSKRTP